MAKYEVSGPVETAPAPKKRQKAPISLLSLIAELDDKGYGPTEIALVADVPPARVKALLKDPRMPMVASLSGSAIGPLEAARMRYRLNKAHDVIDASLDNPNPWLAFQAATVVLSADERRRERTEAVEVIVHSSFLQDAPDDVADQPDLEDDDSFEGQIDAEDAKSMKL